MMKTIFKFLFTTILLLLIITISGIFYLGETTSGIVTTLALAKKYIPGELRIDHAEGKLFSEMSLVNLSYQTETLHITLDALHFKWHMAALFHSILDIDSLAIHHLDIKTISSTHSSGGQFDTDTLKWLNHFKAKRILIKELVFTQDNNPSVNIKDTILTKNDTGNIFFSSKTLAGSFQAKLNLQWQPELVWHIAVTAKSINPGKVWSQWPGKLDFALLTSGNLPQQSLLSHKDTTVHVDLQNISGSLRNSPVNGHLKFAWDHDKFTIQESKITVAENFAEVGGELAEQWNMHWHLHILNFNRILPDAHGSLVSKAQMSGSRAFPQISAFIIGNNIAFAQHKIQDLKGKVNFTLQANTPFTINLTANNLQLNETNFKKINIAINGDLKQNIKAYLPTFAIALDNVPYINAALTIPKSITIDNFKTLPLSAQVQLHFTNLAALQNYIPQSKDLHGKILGEIHFAGSLAQPNFNGKLNLINGSISIPVIGLDLTNINLAISGDQTRKAYYTGSFQAQKGYANIAGTTDLTDDSFTSELTFAGNNLDLVHLADYKITASPDLKIHFTHNQLTIDGTVTIPQAKITPKDFRNTVTLPNEIVYVSNKKQLTQIAAKPTTFIPTTNINLVLGKDVFLHVLDLKTHIAGNLRLITSPKRPPTATGQLYTTDGTYTIYDKTLNVIAGKITYAGESLANPGLNIKAERTIAATESASANFMASESSLGARPTQVGIQISGTVDKPQLTFYSNPSGVSQKDALSYLVFNVPASETSVTDKAILAATIANGKGPSKITTLTNKVKKGLGLSELRLSSVQSYDPQNGISSSKAIVVGKKISKNLTVHYSKAVFQPVSILDLQYRLSKHWSVQSETSKIEDGVDLMYGIERD